jgi:CHAT domain-containing protein
MGIAFLIVAAARRPYLIKDFAVFPPPLPGVSREVNGRKRSKHESHQASLLAFGNPVVGSEGAGEIQDRKARAGFDPLPEAETEVKAFAELFDPNQSRILIEGPADAESFKSLAPAGDIIHCAIHDMFDNHNPLYSIRLFAKAKDSANDDGWLESKEIMRLKLTADPSGRRRSDRRRLIFCP